MDMGQDCIVAIGQIVAEELDVPFKAVKVIMADTATTVNQGGASGSTGIQEGGKQMRYGGGGSAPRAGRDGGRWLGVPADQLTVTTASSARRAIAAKNVSYAKLIGGQYFNVQLDWNKKIRQSALRARQGAAEDVERAQNRRPADQARRCRAESVRAGGLRHRHQSARAWCMRRMIRPAVAGAVPVKVDEARSRTSRAPRDLGKGFLARRRGQGVGCDPGGRQAEGRVVGRRRRRSRDQAALYEHIRKAPVRKREVEKQNGDIDAAFADRREVIEAEYEWPFQSHASMGPACALVEIKDGKVTCWSGTQKSHFVQRGPRRILGVPQDKVHVIWTTGPGSYGRNDADDCAMDAAVLAKAVGKPVRLQYMRDQGTGWDPKGPASIHKARAALDASGKVVAYDFLSKGFSRVDVNTNGSKPYDTLAGQAKGVALKSGDGFGVPAESYAFENKRLAWETISPLLDRTSPLRTSHLRDPVGPQIHFASESFMDEVAARSASIRSNSACATSRTRVTSP